MALPATGRSCAAVDGTTLLLHPAYCHPERGRNRSIKHARWRAKGLPTCGCGNVFDSCVPLASHSSIDQLGDSSRATVIVILSDGMRAQSDSVEGVKKTKRAGRVWRPC